MEENKKWFVNIYYFDFSEKHSPSPVLGNILPFFLRGILSLLSPLAKGEAQALTKWLHNIAQPRTTADWSIWTSQFWVFKWGQHSVPVDTVVRHVKCGSCKQLCHFMWTEHQRKPLYSETKDGVGAGERRRDRRWRGFRWLSSPRSDPPAARSSRVSGFHARPLYCDNKFLSLLML